MTWLPLLILFLPSPLASQVKCEVVYIGEYSAKAKQSMQPTVSVLGGTIGKVAA